MIRRLVRTVVQLAVIVSSVALFSPSAASSQAPALTPIGRITEAVDTLEIGPGRLYTASGRTLTVYDISNPSRPVRTGAYTFPEEIWSFRVSGSVVHAGVNFFGLGILDVSNPASPVLVGSLKTPGQAKTAAVVGARAVVIDHMEGLVDVDLATPARPVKTGSYFLDGYARDVVAVGSIAYAIDSPSGLYAFDLSKSGPLEPVASVQSGIALRTIEVASAPDAKGRRLAALTGGGTLQIYDVTMAAAPTRLSSIQLTAGGALRAALDGSRAYVADGKGGLQVVDLSRPETPRIVNTHPTGALARDVAVHQGVVMIATAEAIEILRAARP